jgi:excisionase family DNA binding protein
MNAKNQIQFIQITPDELQEKILQGITKKLDELKKDFQPKEPTEYLTRNEVRKLFKVDLSTVHNWTKKGKLKAYAIGARVYYKRHEVEQVLTPLNQ